MVKWYIHNNNNDSFRCINIKVLGYEKLGNRDLAATSSDFELQTESA